MLKMNGTNVNFYAESKTEPTMADEVEETIVSMSAMVNDKNLSFNISIMDIKTYLANQEMADEDVEQFKIKVVDSVSAL